MKQQEQKPVDSSVDFLKRLEDALFNGITPNIKFKGLAEMKGGVLDLKGITVEEVFRRFNELAKKHRENYWNMSLKWRSTREWERRRGKRWK